MERRPGKQLMNEVMFSCRSGGSCGLVGRARNEQRPPESVAAAADDVQAGPGRAATGRTRTSRAGSRRRTGNGNNNDGAAGCGGGALELGLEFRAEAEAEAKAHSKRNSNSPSVDFRLAEAVARRVVGSGLRSRRQMSSRPAERLFGAPLFGFRRRTRKPVGWRSFGARSSLNSN